MLVTWDQAAFSLYQPHAYWSFGTTKELRKTRRTDAQAGIFYEGKDGEVTAGPTIDQACH